ncbi:hypothetical protein C942_04560 [Photobacterium marinum]|uniref:Uncharacterized protein n=1 Tax=Photobacterium marinum TaxID=1056511 RepID=L8JDD8_9GAMM|nr:hypothetical protein C942_04560 [Photobacterium marinum]
MGGGSGIAGVVVASLFDSCMTYQGVCFDIVGTQIAPFTSGKLRYDNTRETTAIAARTAIVAE